MNSNQKILVLAAADVERLLTMERCIDLMAETLAALGRDEMHQPLRMIVRPEESRGLMGLMPAYRQGAEGSFGVKAICVFPENAKLGKDAHQGAVILFSADTGELQGIFNASAITAIRTAAVSAVATRLLARNDAEELAIIGAGVQARVHLEAIAKVRKIQRARIVSRNSKHADALATEMAEKFSFAVEPCSNIQTAVDGADIVVTCTNSSEPVLLREWIKPGVHINAVGACSPFAREVDGPTMNDASLFVDRRESTVNEAGDYLLAVAEGKVSKDKELIELGETLNGTKAGRQSKDEITLFKSLGLAAEDLACAEYLFKVANEAGAGARVSF